MDPTTILARHFIEMGYEDLPQEIIKITKLLMLDAVGGGLAGSVAPGVQELFQLMKRFGGEKQCSVIAADTKLPVLATAQVNATMFHAQDFDGALTRAAMKPACVVVPTCFAMAEYIGKLSGKDCIAAIALGTDLLTRMGLATKYKDGLLRNSGWHATTLYGGFGAAGIAGKLLRFNEDTMVNAFGLAYHQASGNIQCMTDGSLCKRMGPGFAVRNGIMAALMAEVGITGPKNCIEGQYNLYKTYHRGGYDREALLKDLGKKFEFTDFIFKPYPCCGFLHASIDATLDLVNGHNIKPEEVQDVTVFCGETEYEHSTPLEIKSKPRTIVDAQFSIPWVVGTAILKRKVSLADFTEEAIKDKRTLQMVSKVKPELAPDLVTPGDEPARVKIVTQKGTYTKQVDYCRGNPQNPMTLDDLTRKFHDCASYSIKPLPKATVDKLIDLIVNLEQVHDVVEIIRLVS